MKTNILPAIRLTLVCILVFMVLYPVLILGVGKLAPAKGEGETIVSNNKVVGYKLEGQNFSADNYFWSRPSAAGYNAASSAGSNKGPSNPDYLKTVQDRIDSFLVHNPGVRKEEIPADLITASGSGLDPDISPAAAFIQVKRIATVRYLPEDKVKTLVDQHVEKPILGPEKVNVLKLNIALDNLK
jgi:potassium-transporting ATPase KdpC subunit